MATIATGEVPFFAVLSPHFSSEAAMVGPSATLLEMQGAAALDSLTDWTAARRAEIDRSLDEYTRFGNGCPSTLAEPIRYSLLAPGKRLRPLLVLMACEACGSDYRTAMPAAAAVEMIHTYSLIHDDLPAMDDDDLRRGRPTCHRAFNEASAILAGDALLAYAFEMVTKLESAPSIVARCCQELAKAAGPTRLVGGQAADIAAEGAEGDIDMLQAIHKRKTGAMFLVSLRLGGIIADAPPTQLAALTTYGEAVGLAFQIVDDLLDCEVSTEEMGKRTQKDSKRGKLTFPRLLGVAASRHRAQELIEYGIGALEPLGGGGERLADLAKYILERKR